MSIFYILGCCVQPSSNTSIGQPCTFNCIHHTSNPTYIVGREICFVCLLKCTWFSYDVTAKVVRLVINTSLDLSGTMVITIPSRALGIETPIILKMCFYMMDTPPTEQGDSILLLSEGRQRNEHCSVTMMCGTVARSLHHINVIQIA